MNDRVRNFLLSLLNATLLLAILLCLCLAFLVYKVESIAGDVINEATTSLLREARRDIDRTVASIDVADRDLKRLTVKVSKLIDKPIEVMDARDIDILTRLRNDVARTNRLIAEVTTLHGKLSDRTIRRIANSIADLIISVRSCRPTGDV